MKKILLPFLLLCQLLYGFNSFSEKTQTGEKSNQTLTKTVFGFLPDWQYQVGSQNYIKYELLTHLAVFSFGADSTGALSKPYKWPWTDVINSAKSKNVKLIMTVSNFTPSAIHKILNDTNIRKTLISNIHSIVVAYSFDGVNIDFENLMDNDKQTPLKSFLDALKSDLNTINMNNELSFASPSVNNRYWDFNLLLSSADYLFVMCYDYYGSWNTTTGPSSPLTSQDDYNVTTTFNVYYSSIVASNPGKLILGVPYYGNYWQVNSKEPYAACLPYNVKNSKNNWIKHMLYNEIIPAYNQKDKQWDSTSQTPWLRWQDTVWNQIWYDDSSSLALKYDLALKKNLKGVGIWALGYDDGRSELWNLIERKFSKTNAIDDKQFFQQDFVLYQNYPNPFNPSTQITYQISTAAYVTLKVYDLLGRELAIIVDEFEQAGIHNSQF
jgi:spore germination protein YaaH